MLLQSLGFYLKSLILCALMLPLSGCFTTTALHSPFQGVLAVDADKKATESAIMKAGALRGWVMTKNAQGEIIGELDNKGHYVKVKFTYNDKTVVAYYLDSRNMDYNGTKIHKKYHMWLSTFFREVNKVLKNSPTQKTA